MENIIKRIFLWETLLFLNGSQFWKKLYIHKKVNKMILLIKQIMYLIHGLWYRQFIMNSYIYILSKK